MKGVSKSIIFSVSLLLLCIIAANNVSATSDVTVFNGWVAYNGDITYKDTTYSIVASNVHLDDETQGKVLIKKNADRFVILFGQCVSDTLYTYCFENRSFDREEVDIDNQGNLQPALKLKLIESSLATKVEKTKTFSKAALNVDDKVEVTLTITNTGDNIISNAKITEIVPNNFKIIKSTHPFYENTAEVNFNVYPGNTWSMTYTIEAISAQDVTYETAFSYESIEGKKEETFGEKKLTFNVDHKFTANKLQKSYTRLDKDSLSLTLENKDTVDITLDTIEVTVSDPSMVSSLKKIFQKSFFSYANNNPIVVKPGESQVVKIDLAFNYVKNYTIEYEAKVHVRDQIHEYNDSIEIEVPLNGISCEFDIPNTVNASSKVPYTISISNSNQEAFYEIEGNYEIANEKSTYELKNINRDASVIVKRGEVVIPFSLEEKKIILSQKAQYRTVDNQYFLCENSQEITIIPATHIIKLDAEFTKKRTQRNSTEILVVELTNLLLEPIKNIEVTFTSDENSATGFILPELMDTYTKEIEVSLNEYLPDKSTSITTNINVPSYTYVDSVSSSIEITNPYVGNVTIVPEKNETQKITIEKITEIDNAKKKLRFFDKVKLFFANFFK